MFFVPIPRKIAKERGLKYYLNGKPCKRGSIFLRKTASAQCVCLECISFFKIQSSISVKQYAVKNKESIAAYKKKYALENKDKISNYQKQHYLDNKEIYIQKATEWNKNNPEKFKANMKKSFNKHRGKRMLTQKQWVLKNLRYVALRAKVYRLKNIDRLNVLSKQWKKDNSHKVRSYSNKRIAIKKSATFLDEFTTFVAEEIMLLNISREKLCGIRFELDHMVPLQSKTVCGLHVWNNLQALPKSMNASKRNSLIYTNPHEWLYDIPKFFKVVNQQEITT